MSDSRSTFASQTAGEPPTELLRSLAVLAEPPGPSHGEVVSALGLTPVPTPAEYSDLFLFQLYPYASVHLGPEGMLGGGARARTAGFWRALGITPPAEPDHIAALLGLYATLAEAASRREGAERALTDQSRLALLSEHIAPWIFGFLDRVVELDRGVYAEWARLTHRVLRAELERAGEVPTRLPAHLREAPELPDPRADGGTAFLEGLLAPVRSGALLVRADLARIAGDHALALRAGERRYALENLLAQDAPAVLTSLAVEARRQAEGHRGRAEWMGVSAVFLAERADRSADLLDALAREAVVEDGAVVSGTATR